MSPAALLDGDGGREPFDRLDVRLLQLIEELPRVGAERLHVLALTLGEDGVKRQGALAGARDSGHDNQLIARDVDIVRLEIVLGGSANLDDLGLSQSRIIGQAQPPKNQAAKGADTRRMQLAGSDFLRAWADRARAIRLRAAET